ncbi:uncharacterized protein LOC131223733 isoform X3 [Magnolia sinica]|uniref:uncharacterized protein LOC131223733 isoform X3 n=1 Tax=Magnolia sinica TaxID=86752 RepID=UPI0026598267|nr:uncharacterized protein LOC131223733 isoform X3 [Magnolia sinica]
MSGFSFSTGVRMLAGVSVPVFSGILMCKIVYEVTGRISLSYFKGYTKLRKEQQVEWNNRGFSTFHALLAAAISFYLVVLSDLFRDDGHDELVINRHSTLSNTILGVSIGYFLADLGMILWCFPALGGKEYVARVLLFIFFFTHMYLHFDQVKMIFPLGFYSILMVPPMISLLNLFWFWKILKGLIKTLSKARHKS